MGFSNGISMPAHLDPQYDRNWNLVCCDCDGDFPSAELEECSVKGCERRSCEDCFVACKVCGKGVCAQCQKKRGIITDGFCENCDVEREGHLDDCELWAGGERCTCSMGKDPDTLLDRFKDAQLEESK